MLLKKKRLIMRTNKNKNSFKYERISSEVERVIREVVSYEIKDKRVIGNATVTGIVLSHDYSHCKVYVQIDVENKKDVLDGLKNASGFVRHVVAEQLDMRKTPEIVFIIDDSLDRAKRIEELLNSIK